MELESPGAPEANETMLSSVKDMMDDVQSEIVTEYHWDEATLLQKSQSARCLCNEFVQIRVMNSCQSVIRADVTEHGIN